MIRRQATPADIPAMQAIAEAAYALYTPRLGGRPPPAMHPDFETPTATGNALVVEEDGRLLAYSLRFRAPEGYLLDNLAVAPEAQGRGIGLALIAEAEEAGRASGAARLILYTNAVMTENQALYERLGFTETRREPWTWTVRVYYAKPL